MAKVGLNFGEKMSLGGKRYRVLNDGLVSMDQIFGKTTFVQIEGPEIVYEDDTSQPRQADGTYPQIATGETRGLVVSVRSLVQKSSIFVTLLEQSEQQVIDLGLKHRDEIELENIVVTYSSVRDNQFKIFASSIKKKQTTGQVPTSQPKSEDKNSKDQK